MDFYKYKDLLHWHLLACVYSRDFFYTQFF